jgi:hypothetical protein
MLAVYRELQAHLKWTSEPSVPQSLRGRHLSTSSADPAPWGSNAIALLPDTCPKETRAITDSGLDWSTKLPNLILRQRANSRCRVFLELHTDTRVFTERSYTSRRVEIRGMQRWRRLYFFNNLKKNIFIQNFTRSSRNEAMVHVLAERTQAQIYI